MESECRLWRGRIRLARGQLGKALDDAGRAVALARDTGDRLNLDPALAFGARVLLAAGPGGRRRQAPGRAAGHRSRGGSLKPELGVDLAGRPGRAAAARSRPGRRSCPRAGWTRTGPSPPRRPGRAARIYAEIGSRPDEAAARLDAARRLLPPPAEGRIELERAIAFFREAGATASLEQAKDLLFALT
jgi:hypothetical protein